MSRFNAVRFGSILRVVVAWSFRRRLLQAHRCMASRLGFGGRIDLLEEAEEIAV
jgi:hypothetical protein